MEVWNLWKHGPERDAAGLPETNLVAATDSIDALMRCGVDLALRFGIEAALADWREEALAAQRYLLGAERDGTWFSITHEREVFGDLPARSTPELSAFAWELADYDEPRHSAR